MLKVPVEAHGLSEGWANILGSEDTLDFFDVDSSFQLYPGLAKLLILHNTVKRFFFRQLIFGAKSWSFTTFPSTSTKLSLLSDFPLYFRPPGAVSKEITSLWVESPAGAY